MDEKIIIIGAGAAGIASAARLYKKGFRNLEILEATNRIGGRIQTVPFGANVVDLGGQWCHGEKGNAVYQLAGPLGLLESSIVSDDNVILRSNGELVPQDIADRMMAISEKIMESKEIERYTGTLGQYFTERFMKTMELPKNRDIGEELIQQFLAYFHNEQRGFIAIDSWYNLTAAGSAADEECEGDQELSWKGKGYRSVLELLLRRHPAQNDVSIPVEKFTKFNKFVTNISWYNGPDRPLVVTCADGTQHEAAHVIVTSSIGVLKENLRTMFTPQLPMAKQKAIKGIYLGTVNKIIMEFGKPFWKSLGNVFGLMWEQEDLEQLRHSKFAWTEGVSMFLKVDRQPNLLVAWMIGPEGRQAEQLPDKEIIDGMMFLLKKFFKNKGVERPIRMIRSKWSSDKNFRGSYSSRSLTTEALKTGHDKMAVPVKNSEGKPVLMFAGEATSEEYFGTVHGAIASGWREADRIVEYYEE
ncbi:amine oxidase [Culex quinquefasciatus]|uniref:Amine oxidase n=1 Tax=Culex quinquefasciatus TaxID=7176 RepID=B0WMR4_CULQU|nr:amine oxidase [Culex quinquefasciatus]|eukprot:XP_001849991.1 amine oxidase [Culex quinquefasciatus]